MGFMEKMLDKNLDVLKKSIEIQNQAHARAVEEARRRGVPPPAAPKLPDFIQRVLEHSEEVKARLAQQKKTHHPAETTNHKVTPTPSSASAKAVPNQTSHHPHASPLPNHLEELFAELAARRDRIDELKQLLEEEKRQVVTHKEHIAEQKATEERLRSQLRAVDAKTVQQADELLSLKEKLKEMKELEARVECLKREIRLQKPSLESVEKKDTTIQSLTARVHATEVELGRYEKRIERLRTQSPGMVALIQTAHMFLEKASPEKSSTMEVLPSSLAPPQRVSETAVHVETVLLEVMRRYRAELTELWPDTASRIGARTLLLRAARHYLLHTIPYARYDARIISTSKTHPTVRITKHVRQLLASMQHCTITSACNGTELHVTMPILPTQNTACMLFPYGTLRVLLDTAHRVNTHPESGQTPGGFDATLQAELGAMADELTVVPYLSRATIDQEPFGRTSILYETTRSSKPGGQAANVTETHVSARLLFDGDVVARAECQDTRSQHENRKIVEERLLVERVAKHNVDLELEAQRSAPRIQSPLSKIPSELNSILFPSGGRTSDAVTQDSHPVGDLEEESLLDRSILRLLFSSSHTPRGY